MAATRLQLDFEESAESAHGPGLHASLRPDGNEVYLFVGAVDQLLPTEPAHVLSEVCLATTYRETVPALSIYCGCNTGPTSIGHSPKCLQQGFF